MNCSVGLLRCDALICEACAVKTVTDLGLMARLENEVVLLGCGMS